MSSKIFKIDLTDKSVHYFNADCSFFLHIIDNEIVIISNDSCISKHPIEERAKYKHDCEHCKYLGNYQEFIDGKWDIYDLYFCKTELETTLIARYSDEPSHYYSGLSAADVIKPLKKAKELAIELGYLKV